MGHEVTSVVAVINDVPQTISNMSRDLAEYEVMHIGGVDISNFLKPEMEKEGLFESFDFNSPQGQKEVDKYKSENCYFAEDYFKEIEKLTNPRKNSDVPKRTNVDEYPPKSGKLQFVKDSIIAQKYRSIFKGSTDSPNVEDTHETTTPSTQDTTIPSPPPKNRAFFEAPEVFFQSRNTESDVFGLEKRIYNVIVKVQNIAYHGVLYENIVISGGSAKIKGLKERLSAEIINAVPRGARLNISFPHEREVGESDGGYTSEDVEAEANVKTNSHGIESLELAAFRGACRLTRMPHYVSLLMAKKDFEEPLSFLRSSIRRSVRISRPPSMIRDY